MYGRAGWAEIVKILTISPKKNESFLALVDFEDLVGLSVNHISMNTTELVNLIISNNASGAVVIGHERVSFVAADVVNDKHFFISLVLDWQG